MAVERQIGCLAQGPHHRHADADVGDEVAVHHVDVQQAAAGGLELRDLLAQTGEVRRQNGGGDLGAVALHPAVPHQTAILAHPLRGCIIRSQEATSLACMPDRDDDNAPGTPARGGRESPDATTQWDLAEPALRSLRERYDLLGELGRGGMGIVYRARDRETGDTVALKVLKPEMAARPELIERFKSELLLARKITHKNVCRVYELNRFGAVSAISMEYVEGESLRPGLGGGGGGRRGGGGGGGGGGRGRRAAAARAGVGWTGLRRAGRSPRPGRCPPRPQAGENPHRPEGAGEDYGLRHRPLARKRRHAHRHAHRHPGLHEPRAGGRQTL